MKSTIFRLSLLALGVAMLPSCSLTYQKLLRERDQKIKQLYAENAELAATHQDSESQSLGARQRIAELEKRLAERPTEVVRESGLDKLRDELPGVDVRMENNRIMLGINNKVTFAAGSTKLKDTAGTVLRRVARVLQREFSGHRVIVEGHTDNDPLKRTKKIYRHNRHLSLERADAVADFLIRKCGVPERAVVVAGYGPHKPIKDGRSKVAKAANRRVEIVVAPGT
ncbi:MAG: OmpA family protein [bacterium]|nr:OmpA family protein [bacterium]